MNVSSTTGFLIAAAVLIVLFFIVIIIWIFLPEQVPGTPYAYRTSSVVLLILAFIFLLIGITLIFFAVNQPPNVVLTPLTGPTGTPVPPSPTGSTGNTGPTGVTGPTGTIRYGDIVYLKNTYNREFADPCGISDCQDNSLNVTLRNNHDFNKKSGRVNNLRKWQILANSTNMGIPISSGSAIALKSLAMNPMGINSNHDLGTCPNEFDDNRFRCIVGPSTDTTLWFIDHDAGLRHAGPTGATGNFIFYGQHVNLVSTMSPTGFTGTSSDRSSDSHDTSSDSHDISFDSHDSKKRTGKSEYLQEESVY
ncbi:MAG TPA: hypothetical protein VKR58_02040, partial [Aquella sp.]|nr:hypothetical protein [Aquella sp.]